MGWNWDNHPVERIKMSSAIKRLGPGDEPILDRLAKEDADFDLDGRGAARRPLDAAAARRYLANPAVFHWVAIEGEEIVGFLYCILLPLRSNEGRELFLYEIGVRKSRRRHGIGRALLCQMEEWMRENGIRDVWVCADNHVAADFYRGCGFSAEGTQPVYMTRRLELETKKPNQSPEGEAKGSVLSL
jgi:ribosomal protein S18 acetylase RimI-like enzyme